jgi:hypothetical protein
MAPWAFSPRALTRGAGLARQHDAVEHQHPIVFLERARIEGCNHRIELLGDRAHRGRAHRPPEDRQQRLADLARRHTEHKTSQDHAVDRRRTPGISPQHDARRKSAGARNRQLDVAALGQQMTRIGAAAAVGYVKRGHAIEMLIDRLIHLPAQDGADPVTAESAITIAPFQPLRLHALHQLESPRQAAKRHRLRRWGALCCGPQQSAEYPLSPP